MRNLNQNSSNLIVIIAILIAITGFTIPRAQAITIVVDYSYDTNNFFNTQARKDALQAAADRFSRIITSSLAAVSPTGTASGTGAGWRIGFSHPGTGASYQISTAASFGTDPLSGSGAADEYGFGGLAADQWILYAGGRPLSSKGSGGTSTGTNFVSTLNDINGPMHRGFNDNTPSDTVGDLPRWGGAITFDTNTTWHFDLGSTAPVNTSDFYSIALHEIGHALGLSTSWNQWPTNGSGQYNGLAAITAYNADNSTSLTSLSLVSAVNPHFADEAYDSHIFSNGSPETTGVISGNRQDLLMEPVANFSAQQMRFELTNTDVAALRDLGWTTLAGVVPDPIQQPDNTVGRTLLSAIGNDIYNTAAGQTLSLRSKKARRVAGVFGVENDGDLSDNFSVMGGRGTSIFRIVYTSIGGNVTAAIIAGTHQTGIISPAAAPQAINVTVIPNKRKIKKVKKRRGRKIITYRKKRLSLILRSSSLTKPTARDFSVLRVRT